MEENENKPESNVKSTIDAVTGLVQAIPVYQDTLQPAAKQVGYSLETVAKAVNIALAPIKAIVWGYEQIEEFVTRRVSEKLRNVPQGNITTPSPQIAGPAIEALRFAGHDENLRELYANLIANAMDKGTVNKAHPGYVDIIKNITSDEAILLQAFVSASKYPVVDVHGKDKGSNGYLIFCSNHTHFGKMFPLISSDLIPAYLDNLSRLGIVEMPKGISMSDDNIYKSLEEDEELKIIRHSIENEHHRVVEFERKVVTLTSFGENFIETVVIKK